MLDPEDRGSPGRAQVCAQHLSGRRGRGSGHGLPCRAQVGLRAGLGGSAMGWDVCEGAVGRPAAETAPGQGAGSCPGKGWEPWLPSLPPAPAVGTPSSGQPVGAGRNSRGLPRPDGPVSRPPQQHGSEQGRVGSRGGKTTLGWAWGVKSQGALRATGEGGLGVSRVTGCARRGESICSHFGARITRPLASVAMLANSWG